MPISSPEIPQLPLKKDILPTENELFYYANAKVLNHLAQFILADMKNIKWSTIPLIAMAGTVVLNVSHRLASLISPSVEGHIVNRS